MFETDRGIINIFKASYSMEMLIWIGQVKSIGRLVLTLVFHFHKYSNLLVYWLICDSIIIHILEHIRKCQILLFFNLCPVFCHILSISLFGFSSKHFTTLNNCFSKCPPFINIFEYQFFLQYVEFSFGKPLPYIFFVFKINKSFRFGLD